MKHKATKRLTAFLSLLVALVLIGTAIPFAATAASSVPTVPTPSSNGWDGKMASSSLSGKGTSDDPYQIGSAADLLCCANMIKASDANKLAHYQLTADIDLNHQPWVPMGAAGKWFGGTLDGNGKTVNGLYINEKSAAGLLDKAGLFGIIIKGATVKDLTINGFIVDNGATGTITGAAPVCGIFQGGTVENVTTDVKIYLNANGAKAGGILNCFRNSVTVSNCSATVDITLEGTKSYAGGIMARQDNSYDNVTVRVTDCKATGKIKLTNTTPYAGGIVAEVLHTAKASCFTTVSKCYTDVDITLDKAASCFAGGIAGLPDGGTLLVSNSVAEGNITAANAGSAFYIGGLVGSSSIASCTGTTRTIQNSYYTGAIDITCNGDNAAMRAGGIAGALMNGVVVSDCYMLGSVKLTNATGTTANMRVGIFVGGFGYGQNGASIAMSTLTNCGYLANAVNTPAKGIGHTSNASIAGLTDAVTFRASQANTVQADRIRLVSTLGSIGNYTSAGYRITAVKLAADGSLREAGTATEISMTRVYSLIQAAGSPVTPESLGASATDSILAMAINGIPTEGSILLLVTPFVVEGGVTKYAATTVLNFTNGTYDSGYQMVAPTNN